MERFDERSVDLWREWMWAETAYARVKFSDHQRRFYFEQGVARGDVSLKMGAMGYLMEALSSRILVEEIEGDLPLKAKLKISRGLGKSAQNQMACLAETYECFEGYSPTDSFDQAMLRVESLLMPDEPTVQRFIGLDDRLALELGLTYDRLQELQDASDTEQFALELAAQGAVAAMGFISASNHYAWVKPGVARGEELEPWLAKV